MESIKDKVAIIGMGCTRFGERWDKSGYDLLVDAAYEAYADAGIEPKDIQAAWLGQLQSGSGGNTAADALQLDYIPISNNQNACATGGDTIRNAAYAVASGTYDIVLAIGFEKLKDFGIAGLGGSASGTSGTRSGITLPAAYALSAQRFFRDRGLTDEEGKRLIGQVAVKNHHNGALNPRAHFQREVTMEQVLNAPIIAWPLGLYDCCGVSDGSAAAILVRGDWAEKFRKDAVFIKALSLSTGPRRGHVDDQWDYITFDESVVAGKRAYEEAGIKDPFKELSLAELHDCFSITETILYEALGFCPKGAVKEYVEGGAFEMTGELPVDPDGGLKCFGHPVSASGIRMMYEVYKQCQGKAEKPERQLKNVELGLTHNQGGNPPAGFVVSVNIAGIKGR